jgi:hemoglobin
MENFYEKIGEERLNILVEEFYNRVFKNEIISHLFANSDPDDIKRKQKLFLTQFFGGPAVYTEQVGVPKMRQRHFPHKINEEAKNEWLKCMKEAIQALDWDDRSKYVLYSMFPKLAGHMVNSK